MVRFAVFSVIVTSQAHSGKHANHIATITAGTNAIQKKFTDFMKGKAKVSDLPTKIELEGLAGDMNATKENLENVNKTNLTTLLDNAKAAVNQCNTDFKETTTAIRETGRWTSVVEAAENHHICRRYLAEECYPNRDTACKQLDAYRLQVINDLKDNIPCVADSCADYKREWQNCNDCSGQANGWHDRHYGLLTGHMTTCNTQTNSCEERRQECDRLQGLVEAEWCLYEGEIGDAYENLDTCYLRDYSAYENQNQTTVDGEVALKGMFAAAIKVDCFVQVIDLIANTAGHEHDRIDLSKPLKSTTMDKVRECLSLDPDTSSMDIDYEPYPQDKDTTPPSDFDLDKSPEELFYDKDGTKEYTDASYLLAEVVPCSN